jgi:2'-5' RNA ligase
MRLFVALELPADVKASLAEVPEKLKHVGMDAKWIEPGDMHITLKFLGEVEDGMLPGVKAGIERAVRDVKPFGVSLEGAGTFGRPPRVVWVGTGKGKEKVTSLMRNLESGLGFIRKEGREPSPHLTLGRIRSCRDRQSLDMAVEGIAKKAFGEFTVEEIELKKSVLTTKGPVYSTVGTFRLG